MVFKNRIRDPIAAFRGSGPSVSPTIPVNHKVQKPITTLSTDTILQARSNSLKCQGSIGVVGGGILKKESRHPSINNDDSSLYSIGTFDDGGGFHANNIDNDTIVGGVDTNNDELLLDNSERRRVRWGKDVKEGSRHGCGVGMEMERGCAGVTTFYNGLITNLNVINDKLDSGMVQLNTRFEGLGMKACGSQHVHDDIVSSEAVNEDNDLIYSPKDEMLTTLLETRDAIKASSDAIVSSRDAINEKMRESRQCIEESRGIMSDCREAIKESNNIAKIARDEGVMKLTSPKNKHFTFDQRGGPGSPRRVAKYRHSIETGMGDANVLSPTQEDPFSSSMHAHQRSPRGAMLHTYQPSHGTKAVTSPSNAADVPTTRKNRRASSSAAAAIPTYINTKSSRARQLLVSATGKRHRDKKQYRTTNVSVKNADKHSTSTTRYNNNTSTKPSTSSSSKKKKNRTSLVIGGLKKPLKFMSHGVKSNLKTRGPKLVLTWA